MMFPIKWLISHVLVVRLLEIRKLVKFVTNSRKKNDRKMSDWDTVTVLKKKAPKASTMKSEKAVNAARRQGVPVDTQLKCE